ncbi:DUF1559 family PulG-like putative transporter [Bythopirellula goksoeyrii]|uniref:DUF1559 domain-containing protein n=1 Tax=Bythopirellula goksoeyrii TaxID=1400387 RepID=A0A5B9QEL9_9BACT|nr:DUF1559 domain-containing protein [Bythopirellula goksoeyrii]QEG37458.1 hypothetical protein Pr1d_48040 [Bythopirellula goksoeyrii]
MQRSRIAITLLEVLGVIAIIVLLVALLLPAVRTARPAARRNSCMNNLKQISLAILNYESENGTLPPEYTVDEDGNRLHSWRTLILPYMEQSKLYESIDLTKPWDAPANAKARETVVEVYQCPSSDEADGLTNYLAVVGSFCAFSDSTPRELSEATDGPEKSIMLIEVNSDLAVPWMSPNDTSVDEIVEKVFVRDSLTNHPGTINVAFLDGRVSSIQQEVDQEVLRALLTIDGGETIPEP